MQIRVWVTARLISTSLLLAAFTSACELGEVFEADRFIDATVPLEGAGRVVLDVPVPVRVTGGAFGEVTVTGTVTVVTSSATRSRELADALRVEEIREDGVLTTGVQVPGEGGGTPFPEATLRGALQVTLPSDVELQVLQRGGSTVVEAMRAELDVRSVGPVQVLDAPSSVSVRCDNGPVEVRTRAAAGTRTFLGMVAGSEARVVLPRTLSARVIAQTGDGNVFLQHPQLPRGSAQPYDVTVGGGLAEVEVSVGRGNIVLLAP